MTSVDGEERTVYSVTEFNGRVARYVKRLPEVWVEGELTELRRQPGRATVYFTLKDAATGACLSTTMHRNRFDRLSPTPEDGEHVQILGRAELYALRATFSFRAMQLERVGLGAHLVRLERLRRQLSAEGLFSPARKRPLPRFPRGVGVVTGRDAAARGDLIAAIHTRYPPARLVIVETRVQGAGAARSIVAALSVLAERSDIDVIVLTRGGGSFEDLLPFSDENVVRAVASTRVPIVSAVGHEQDVPLCDLAADGRAATPTAAARLVVPDLDDLLAGLHRSRKALRRALERRVENHDVRLAGARERLRRAPSLVVERHRAKLESAYGRLVALSPAGTLRRGYAIVRTEGRVVRAASELDRGTAIELELGTGAAAATVDEVWP